MDAGEICSRKTVIIREDKFVKDAVKLLKQYNVGSLVVVKSMNNHNVPVGLLTDRDIVIKALPAQNPLDTIPVREIMSTPVITVTETTSIFETLSKMRYSGIRRLPVINEEGFLTGILSLDDIIDSIARELIEVTRVVQKEEPVV